MTPKIRIGLAIAALLALTDVAGPFTIPASGRGEPGPPMLLLITSAVLGLITLAAVALAWRTGSRLAARIAAATRIISALGSGPAFLVADDRAGLIVAAAAGIVLTLISAFLLLSRVAK